MASKIVPLLMTSAAALIAWGEMARFRELSNSYTMARDELEGLESIARVRTQKAQFLDFIEIVEEPISREHTMWCVKRDSTVLSGGA